MPDNPYSPPTLNVDIPTSRLGRCSANVMREILKYVGSYLLGISVCVIGTPVDLAPGGVPLWPLYFLLSPIGILLYCFYLPTLPSAYWPFGASLGYWSLASIGLIPFVFEVTTYFRRLSRLRRWRLFWVGFPIGFVGTLRIYYTATASI